MVSEAERVGLIAPAA